MLNTYKYRTDVYINGQHVERHMTSLFLLEEDEVNTPITIEANTFDEVWALYQDNELRWCMPGSLWCFKEGKRRIEFYDCLPFTHKWNMLEHKPSTWKTVKVVCEPVEWKYANIEDILKLRDTKRAIKYLTERGLGLDKQFQSWYSKYINKKGD